MGGYFETMFSINPHWQGEFNELPKHPVANGVKPFTTNDEWYYHMRFRPEMKGVTELLKSVPPDQKREAGGDLFSVIELRDRARAVFHRLAAIE